MHKLKLVFITLGFSLAASASSARADELFTVVTRNPKGKVEFKAVHIDGLLNPEFAETKDFKIVEQKSDQALRFSEVSAEDRMRAANLLYHLAQAKQFFIDHLQSTEVAYLEQIIVRINLFNRFDNIGHFANDNKDPQYNNAHTIPLPNPAYQIGIENAPQWKREIWFRPVKKILTRDLLADMAENPLAPMERDLRKAIYPSLLQQGLASTLGTVFNSNAPVGPVLATNSIRQGGTALAMEGVFQVMRVVNRAASPKFYFLDTPMVPEIIAHEFSHVALSDYLNPTIPTPVVEGMADYFAAAIGGNPQLAKKIKRYSKGVGKDGRKPQTFRIAFDTNGKATADFVLSVLWGIREVLGAETADQLIWKSRIRLNTYQSTLRDGDASLVDALVNTCINSREICPDAVQGQLKILQYLSSDIGF